MTEPDVTLTDYALGLQCLSLAFLFWKKPASLPLKISCAGYFFCLGTAALLGGTWHGFFLHDQSLLSSGLWRLTLVFAGIAGGCLGLTGISLLAGESAVRRGLKGLAVCATVYAVFCLFITHHFWIAYCLFVPGLVLLLSGLAVHAGRGERFGWIGLTACSISLLSCAVQHFTWKISGVPLSHNALAHVVQMLATGLLYVSFRGIARRFHQLSVTDPISELAEFPGFHSPP